MYCTSCGAQNLDNAFKCVECNTILQNIRSPQIAGGVVGDVPNYLPQAILSTIFCCWPFGIVAIVYAAQVNGLLAAGNYARAVENSNKAKTWCWITFGIGLAVELPLTAIYMLMLFGTVLAS